MQKEKWQSKIQKCSGGVHPRLVPWSGTSPDPTTGEILSTKYEILNNIEAQNLNDQNMKVLNLEH